MKLRLLLVGVSALILGACGNGVPNVDDPHNVVVGGQKMKQGDFLAKYCEGKSSNDTCRKVYLAMHQDSTRGAMPKW